MQQSSDRFSTLLSSHIISVNKSACFYKSWLWCLEAIWVFTISADKQLILQVPVLWLSPDAFWCRSASAMSGTFFASLCTGAVLLKRHSNPNHFMILCIPRPPLDSSDLCKQGIGHLGVQLFPQSTTGALVPWLPNRALLWALPVGDSLLPITFSRTIAFACWLNPYFLGSVVTL